MPRAQVTRETLEPGLRRVTRTHDDGRTLVRYEVRKKQGTTLLNVGTFTTEKAARKALHRATVQADEGLLRPKSAGNISFLAVAEEWMQLSDWKPRTRDTNRAIVDKHLASLHAKPIGKVTYADVKRLTSGLAADGLAPATRRRVEAVLRAVCAEAVKRDYITADPCAKVERVKVGKRKPSIPSPAQVEQLISYLAEQREDGSPPWDLLVEFAAYSGLRAGEVAGLRKRNLDMSAGEVTVDETVVDRDGVLESGEPKSEESRRTVGDLDPDLCQRLAAHVKGLHPGDYVFGSYDSDGRSRPYRHGNFVSRVFNPAREALGLDKVRFHDLRHYYASLLINEGVDVAQVAARLGHHDAAFTLRTYVHLFAKEDTGLSDRIAARRAAARKATSNVVPLRKAAGS